jgi:hypothetical protein
MQKKERSFASLRMTWPLKRATLKTTARQRQDTARQWQGNDKARQSDGKTTAGNSDLRSAVTSI